MQPSRKGIQNNDSEDDPGSCKRMEANIEMMQEMFTKDLEEQKNKKQMNNTLKWISSRKTDAEEQVSDLVDRMVKIIITEQNVEKRMKREWRQP